MNAWDATFDMDWDPPGRAKLVVRADCEDGSKCDFTFTLPVDVAEQLARATAREMGSWLAEKDEAEAAFRRRDPRYMPREVMMEEGRQLLDDGVYDGDPAKWEWAQRVASGEERPS